MKINENDIKMLKRMMTAEKLLKEATESTRNTSRIYILPTATA